MTQAPARALLRTKPAPFNGAPMVVHFSVALQGGTLTIAYGPDRDLLVRESLTAYAAALPATTPEETVATIADDIANELVPKWHRVTLALNEGDISQIVTIEDRQPGMDRPSLPSGLP